MQLIMKKIIVILVLMNSMVELYAQTNEVDVKSGFTKMDAPSGTYIKDIYNTFTPFLGTWRYQSGNEIFTVKLEKVTKKYYPEYGTYRDYIKGNYSYTTDGGATFVVNTIIENNDLLPLNFNHEDPLYSPRPDNSQYMEMAFRDVIHQKSCSAVFTFLPSSTTQMNFNLDNVTRGYIWPETIPNQNFSVPDDVILIKQP